VINWVYLNTNQNILNVAGIFVSNDYYILAHAVPRV